MWREQTVCGTFHSRITMCLFTQRKAQMHQTLLAELTEAGVNISDAQAIENDGLEYDSENEIVDPGYVDPEDGAFKRPWCPATRILEHRENEKTER